MSSTTTHSTFALSKTTSQRLGTLDVSPVVPAPHSARSPLYSPISPSSLTTKPLSLPPPLPGHPYPSYEPDFGSDGEEAHRGTHSAPAVLQVHTTSASPELLSLPPAFMDVFDGTHAFEDSDSEEEPPYVSECDSDEEEDGVLPVGKLRVVIEVIQPAARVYEAHESVPALNGLDPLPPLEVKHRHIELSPYGWREF